MLKKTRLSFALAIGLALLLTVSVGLPGEAAARRNRTVAIQESATLKVTEKNEKTRETIANGSGTGTFNGKVHMQVRVINGSKLASQFVTKTRGGSFTGEGTGRYSVSGSILRFFGTVKVTGGTGVYVTARGNGINIEGVMNRVSERMKMTLKGKISF